MGLLSGQDTKWGRWVPNEDYAAGGYYANNLRNFQDMLGNYTDGAVPMWNSKGQSLKFNTRTGGYEEATGGYDAGRDYAPAYRAVEDPKSWWDMNYKPADDKEIPKGWNTHVAGGKVYAYDPNDPSYKTFKVVGEAPGLSEFQGESFGLPRTDNAANLPEWLTTQGQYGKRAGSHLGRNEEFSNINLGTQYRPGGGDRFWENVSSFMGPVMKVGVPAIIGAGFYGGIASGISSGLSAGAGGASGSGAATAGGTAGALGMDASMAGAGYGTQMGGLTAGQMAAGAGASGSAAGGTGLMSAGTSGAATPAVTGAGTAGAGATGSTSYASMLNNFITAIKSPFGSAAYHAAKAAGATPAQAALAATAANTVAGAAGVGGVGGLMGGKGGGSQPVAPARTNTGYSQAASKAAGQQNYVPSYLNNSMYRYYS